MLDTPAVVLNGRLEIVTANALGRALFAPVYALADDHEGPPNNARFVFLDPNATTFFREWDTVANDTVAILRAEAGRDPYDRALSDLVGQLSTRSEDFRRTLGRPRRAHPRNRRQALHHPVVGDLDLPYESLPLAPGSSTSLVAYTPEPDSASRDTLALLASWAASVSDSGRPTPAKNPSLEPLNGPTTQTDELGRLTSLTAASARGLRLLQQRSWAGHCAARGEVTPA